MVHGEKLALGRVPNQNFFLAFNEGLAPHLSGKLLLLNL